MINLSALKANIDNEIEASKKESPDVFRCGMPLAEIVSEALEQTLDVDMVEVVRCKDCEYCHMSTDPKTNISVQVCGYVGYNPVQSSQVSDNDFCSHGERRTKDD